MLILAGLIALVATLVAIVWLIGASEPVQRLGVASPVYREAYVVVGKNAERNQLTVALERPDTPLLWAREATVGSLHFTGREPFFAEERRLQAQPRYRHFVFACGHHAAQQDDVGVLHFPSPSRLLSCQASRARCHFSPSMSLT